MYHSLSKRIVLLILGIVLFLAGCTPGTEGNLTPTPAPQVVLIWWNLFEPEENVKLLIEAYQNAHPNVTIQYSQKDTTTGIDNYKTELDEALGDNDPLTTPDIFSIHNTWTDKYAQYIATAPASVLTQNDLDDFYQVVKDDFVHNNNIYALPLYLDTMAIIYNKDKLQNAGYTVPAELWSDFKVQAQALTTKNQSNLIDTAGFSANIPENSEFMFDMINLLFLQNGVQMTDVTASRAIFSTQREAQDAIDFYQSLTKGTNPTWNKQFKKDIAMFLEKRLAMYAAPSWRLIDILNYNNTFNLGLNVGVAPVPQVAGDSVHWATYWGQTVAKDSIHQDVAWDFIKFITQAEQLRLLNKTVKDNGRPIGIIYPRQSMASEISNDPYLGPYTLSAARAKSWNMKDGYAMKKTFLLEFAGDVKAETLESAATNVLQGKNN